MTSPTRTFATERLQLAIFLHASGRLRFLRCEAVCNGLSPSDKCIFVFADPKGEADTHEWEFSQGAAVAATALFASQKFLRRKMSEAKTQTLGESSNERSSR